MVSIRGSEDCYRSADPQRSDRQVTRMEAGPSLPAIAALARLRRELKYFDASQDRKQAYSSIVAVRECYSAETWP